MLDICVIAYNVSELNWALNDIMKIEGLNDNVISRSFVDKTIKCNDCIYRGITLHNYNGLKADQIFAVNRFALTGDLQFGDVVSYLLRNSCVPKEFAVQFYS